jgi:hypothetical protein
MIKCICINDKNKPKEIPESKWVKKGEEYTVIFTIMVMPQRELALQLDEIDLDESCMPYEYFLATRFAFDEDDVMELLEFINQCIDVNLSINELINQKKTI